MKFKVGDRVNIDNNYATGTIVGVWDSTGYYIVATSRSSVNTYEQVKSEAYEIIPFKGNSWLLTENRLKSARIKNTKIARKLRAKEISKIENGWIYLKELK